MEPNKIKKLLMEKNLVKTKDTGWYKKPIDAEVVECERAIYLIRRETYFRKICFNLQKHKYFDRIIMLLIVLSSVKLATDTYMDGLS